MDSKLNILVIVVDTLRADHLECYGYNRPTSPHIDALAAEGALCERLFCTAIPTQPSFTTLYTGQHAINHGIVAHGGKAQLAKEAPWVTQFFLQEGYTTCAVDNLARERRWFARGYEYYIDPSIRRTLHLSVSLEELNRRAIPWLRNHAGEPFFMLIHPWDPHYPFDPPERYHHLFYDGRDPRDPNNRSLDSWWRHPVGQMARDTWLMGPDGVVTDAEYLVALYDQEIRHLDDAVGDLIAVLDELGLAERTLVMLTADHGESLTEHGIYFEHHGLYDCTIRVPLIARLPGIIPKGIRLPHLLQYEDITPTLLEAADLPIPAAMDGRSFWQQLSGEEETGGRQKVISLECTWQAKWSLRNKRYKFILARSTDFYGNPRGELYDLQVDPGEERNLVEEMPDLAASMEAELEDCIAERLSSLGRSEDPLVEQGPSLAGVLQTSE